jgi:predicted esterase
LIVAPEALSRAYFEEAKGVRRIGASWMTKEARESEIDDYVHYLDQVADEVLRDITPVPRVEVHGFSQGAAAAARWVTYGRHTVNRLVAWGSPLPPDLDVERLRAKLKDAPLVLVSGNRDHYVDPQQMQAELARLQGLRVPIQFESFAGGHKVDSETLTRLAAEG